MGWRKPLAGVLIAAAAAALAVHYRVELGAWIVDVEQWIAGHGVWGPIAFAALYIVLTSMFFPDSVLSASAGALFGTLIGTAVIVVGAIITQGIAFTMSRRFLRKPIGELVANRPKFAAIQRAADREGLRLQFLLRLTPLNPVIVSHVLGTTGSRLGVFLLACLGLVPGLFVQVYCGYTAKHMLKAAGQVSEHSTLQTVLVVVGLAACVLVFVLVTRMAQRAIASAELEAL